MQKIDFTKMVASGNDFVVIPVLGSRPQAARLTDLARKICDRKFGVGADGLLVLEKSKLANIKMRIFNADGSEAAMCGNGAGCVAYFLSLRSRLQASRYKIETKAGIIEAELNGDKVKIKLTEPGEVKTNIPIKLNCRLLKVNLINTGVPHTVIFVEGLDNINVVSLGRQIRYHNKFKPAGTNVDFVEVLNNNYIKIRTYERGVEDETLACGTGAVASGLIANYGSGITDYEKINVRTKSGEILKVYFKKDGNKFKDVWLEAKARIVYEGVYYV